MVESATSRSERGKYPSIDILVPIVFMLVALGFGIAAWQEHVHAGTVAALASKGLYDASPAEVIGAAPHVIGRPDAPYTLVEFGDYQCPPCRAANPSVMGLLAKYPKTVRYVFRNLPLTTIHPLAMQAATIAEESDPADFWQVHKFLYAGPVLTPHILAKATAAVDAERDKRSASQARAEVRSDEGEAQALDLGGTPSFLLCCPSGLVRRVQRIGTTLPAVRAAGGLRASSVQR